MIVSIRFDIKSRLECHTRRSNVRLVIRRTYITYNIILSPVIGKSSQPFKSAAPRGGLPSDLFSRGRAAKNAFVYRRTSVGDAPGPETACIVAVCHTRGYLYIAVVTDLVVLPVSCVVGYTAVVGVRADIRTSRVNGRRSCRDGDGFDTDTAAAAAEQQMTTTDTARA